MKNVEYSIEVLGYPPISEFVNNFVFSYFNRTINFSIAEDDQLNSLKYVMAIRDIFDKTKSQTPGMRGKDQITLTVLQKKKKVATIRFGGVSLQGHFCSLKKNKATSEMLHEVALCFERVEIDKPEKV